MSEIAGSAVVAGVRDLLPVLAERAQETEDARDVPAESVKAIEETGFFRLVQPARFGGLEAEPVTFLSAVRLIASACGSTGWVASVLGVHAWQLALFPPPAQEEVWAGDPAARMSSSYAPTGRAEAVAGGHRLTGRWSFSSGCNHATWVLLGAIAAEGDGRPVDFRTFLLPASDYTIDDVWDTVGLRGTGSNDIVVDGAFVPEHRSLSFTDVFRCRCPGHEVNAAPLYRLPYGSLFSYSITTPIIGMATGAYDAHVAYQRERVRAAYVGQKAKEDPFGQVRIAEAAVPAASGIVHLMVEVATLDDVGRAMDRCARRGAPVSGSLGRHANDQMVSFYVRTPGGFDIEYGTGGLRVDDATWVTRETTTISLWGHSFATPGPG